MAIASTTTSRFNYITHLSQVTVVYNPDDLNAAAIRIAISRAIASGNDALLNAILKSIYDSGQTLCVNYDDCDASYCNLPYYICEEIMNIDVAQYDQEFNDWDNKWSVYVRHPEAVDKLVQDFILSVRSSDPDNLHVYLNHILTESECATGPSAYLVQALCRNNVDIRLADRWMEDETLEWVNEYEVTIDGAPYKVRYVPGYDTCVVE